VLVKVTVNVPFIRVKLLRAETETRTRTRTRVYVNAAWIRECLTLQAYIATSDIAAFSCILQHEIRYVVYECGFTNLFRLKIHWATSLFDLDFCWDFRWALC